MAEHRGDAFADVFLFYELALATGHSLDPAITCQKFLDLLMVRKRFAFAAVWVSSDRYSSHVGTGYELLYAAPAVRIRDRNLPSNHPQFSALGAKEPELVHEGEMRFKECISEIGTTEGTVILFPLGDFGLLKLQSTQADAVAEKDLRQLRGVIAKFSIALEGCLAHARLLGEYDARRRAHEELEAAKKRAETADRSKTEFLAAMSHELRTPLNAIIGYSELILQDTLGPVQPEVYRTYLENVVSAGHILDKLLADILDIARIETDNLPLFEETVEVPEIVSDVVRLVDDRAKRAGISVHTEFDHQLPLIRADERRLKQILTNLLTNALKFTAPGGEARVAARRSSNGDILLEVSDTGIGIAPEDVERVLQPFVQVDGSLARKHDGVGLGLSLCRQMAEQHGGNLRINSELGKGTRVALVLPCRRIIE